MADDITNLSEALRRIRGDHSLRAFAAMLVANGVPAATLSRQRISQVEQGTTSLPPELWAAVHKALHAAGYSDAQLASLTITHPPAIDPSPASTPAFRRAQWDRILRLLPGNRWWQGPTTITARVLGNLWVAVYHDLARRFDVDASQQRDEIRRRLASDAAWTPQANDRVAVVGGSILRTIRTWPGAPFVMRIRLTNRGPVAWKDRMLYRLGPIVSSSLPFTPALIPIPDTEPGDTATVTIAGRAQVFPNLAVISHVMVFADCTQCLPGIVRFFTDTRQEGQLDGTLAVSTKQNPQPQPELGPA